MEWLDGQLQVQLRDVKVRTQVNEDLTAWAEGFKQTGYIGNEELKKYLQLQDKTRSVDDILKNIENNMKLFVKQTAADRVSP